MLQHTTSDADHVINAGQKDLKMRLEPFIDVFYSFVDWMAQACLLQVRRKTGVGTHRLAVLVTV
jgi:hypothetical protein